MSHAEQMPVRDEDGRIGRLPEVHPGGFSGRIPARNLTGHLSFAKILSHSVDDGPGVGDMPGDSR
jgi:hypothetical protein